MQRATRTFSAILNPACLAGVLILSGCTQEEAPAVTAPVLDEPAAELKWARAALERNPDLKVVSVDAERHTVKVTIKSTGNSVDVTPGELAAIPIADLVALTNSVHAPR